MIEISAVNDTRQLVLIIYLHSAILMGGIETCSNAIFCNGRNKIFQSPTPRFLRLTHDNQGLE